MSILPSTKSENAARMEKLLSRCEYSTNYIVNIFWDNGVRNRKNDVDSVKGRIDRTQDAKSMSTGKLQKSQTRPHM